jgi:hypothetical protein
MKTLLLLVEDDYANSLKQQLPSDKAWVMPERYDAFRCALHHALESARSNTGKTVPLQNAISDMNAWLAKVS